MCSADHMAMLSVAASHKLKLCHHRITLLGAAMHSHPPRASWVIYLAYSLIFIGFTLSTRLVRDVHDLKAPNFGILLRGKPK